MSSNTFGKLFSVTSFGESHGPAMGVVIDGMPAGVEISIELLHGELARRKPGLVGRSARQEDDTPEVLSGVLNGKTLGTPIAVIVKNKDARSEDYQDILDKKVFRSGHADQVWEQKFGIADLRGGGRASGRETVSRVIAGAFAKMLLNKVLPNLVFETTLVQIGLSQLTERLDSQPLSERLVADLEKLRTQGESAGAVLELKLKGMPVGLGEPVFYKLKARLAEALLSIGGVLSVQLGVQEQDLKLLGTEFYSVKNSGLASGCRGGISNGQDLVVRVGFKPTSSIQDVAKKGRHDPCIAIRAAVVCESMIALVLSDLYLMAKCNSVGSN